MALRRPGVRIPLGPLEKSTAVLFFFYFGAGMPVDAHGKLAAEPFSWYACPDGGLRIYWEGKLVRTLPTAKATLLLSKLELASAQEVQLLLAKATGNFKRGNEQKHPK